MTNRNSDGDSWGQLLSEFGIEDETPKDITSEEISEQPAGGEPGLTDSDESAKPKEKKSIFSRFPKINFFGAPPEISLDSVIEGVKTPSLGGKAFTDNKMEKMPLSQGRTDRQDTADLQGKDDPDVLDAWSAVASQISTLASSKEPNAKPTEHPTRRRVASMFDDPIPESEEVRALKNLMDERPYREEKSRTGFLEEESGSPKRSRGRRYSQPEPEENKTHGRGSGGKQPVTVDDLPEGDYESTHDVPTHEEYPRGRGRRGSRYAGDVGGGVHRGRGRIHEHIPQEEWSEVDAALQQADRSKRATRGNHRQRYDNHQQDNRHRAERRDDSAFSRNIPDEDDSGMTMVHPGNIPSWDEAIGGIIAGNVARHKSNPRRSRSR